MVLRLAGATAALLVPAARAIAQAAMGEVMTDTGKPLAGFPVIITGNGESHVAITDPNGVFRVPGLKAGQYTVAPASDTAKTVPFQWTAPVDAGQTGLWARMFAPDPGQRMVPGIDIGRIVVPTGP